MKIARLLAITVLMLNRRKVTAKELAEEFEVSIRTIYRDVDTLNAAGIPVVSWQGYEGGFCIPDEFKLRRHLFTFDDLVSVLTTLKGVNRTLNNREISAAIETLTALIPDEKEDLFSQKSDSFVVDITPWGGTPDLRNHITEIHNAVSSSSVIRFRYSDAGGRLSLRETEPHTLVYKGFGWYLIAYCRLREDFRIFKLNRMSDLEITENRFIRRPVDPDQFFNEGNDSRPLCHMELQFPLSMKLRVEESFPPTAISECENGDILVKISLPEDDWLHSMILSFGEDVRVISPEQLRFTLKEKIAKMMKNFSSQQ